MSKQFPRAFTSLVPYLSTYIATYLPKLLSHSPVISKTVATSQQSRLLSLPSLLFPAVAVIPVVCRLCQSSLIHNQVLRLDHLIYQRAPNLSSHRYIHPYRSTQSLQQSPWLLSRPTPATSAVMPRSTVVTRTAG